MININDLPKQIDSAVAKRYKEKLIQKEKYIFFALCSDADRVLITGESELDLENFERISYLMQTLGFENLRNHFIMCHSGLLTELGEKIKKENSMSVEEIEKEMRKAILWDRKFIDQITSEKTRNYIKKVFAIS